MKGWMVRASRNGRLFEDFCSGYAAIGWNDLGDLNQYSSADALRDAYIDKYGNSKPAKTANAVAMLRKFRDGIQAGDMIITYSPETREYMIGEDLGEYYFVEASEDEDTYSNRRKVFWLNKPDTPRRE